MLQSGNGHLQDENDNCKIEMNIYEIEIDIINCLKKIPLGSVGARAISI